MLLKVTKVLLIENSVFNKVVLSLSKFFFFLQINAPTKPLPSVAATPATSTVIPKKKKKWKEVETKTPVVTFKDFGGSSKALVVG